MFVCAFEHTAPDTILHLSGITLITSVFAVVDALVADLPAKVELACVAGACLLAYLCYLEWNFREFIVKVK